MLRVKVPSTIANIGPGFDVMAMAVNVSYDVVEVSLIDEPKVIIEARGTYSSEVPRDPTKNTAGLVALRILEEHAPNMGVMIVIEKGIRPRCGLGSSGADAAATAYALNKLLSLGLSEHELMRIAAQGEIASAGSPHMDNVAAALLGGLVILDPREGLITRVDVSEIPLLVVIPEAVRKPSTKAMRSVVPDTVTLRDALVNVSHAPLVALGLMRGDPLLLGRGIEGDKLVEPRRAPLYPHYHTVKDVLKRLGALGVALCGAGPSMLAVFNGRPPVTEVEEGLRRLGVRALVCEAHPINKGVTEL